MIIVVIVIIIIVVVIIIIGSSSSSSSSIIIIIPSIRGYTFTPAERGSLALFPVRVGGLRTISLCHIAASKYEASTAITEPLVEQIVAQTHELLDDRAIIRTQQQRSVTTWRRMRALETTMSLLNKLRERGADLAAEKGAGLGHSSY